jgi:hypothetical protein
MPYCHGKAECNNNWSLYMYSEKLFLFFFNLATVSMGGLSIHANTFNPWVYYMSQGPGLYQNMGPKDERDEGVPNFR